MKFPSDSYEEADGEKWLGPCDDSFCCSSCTSPHCQWRARLGNTPKEHNEMLRQMKEDELEACKKRIAESEESE